MTNLNIEDLIIKEMETKHVLDAIELEKEIMNGGEVLIQLINKYPQEQLFGWVVVDKNDSDEKVLGFTAGTIIPPKLKGHLLIMSQNIRNLGFATKLTTIALVKGKNLGCTTALCILNPKYDVTTKMTNNFQGEFLGTISLDNMVHMISHVSLDEWTPKENVHYD
jgi:hypothetical protein